MLELERITKYYGKKIGVENLSLKIAPGETMALLGINGSGKTTTFRMILGLLEPTKGEILFNYAKIKDLQKSVCGYIPEERSLYKDLTVEQQLRFLGSLHQMNKMQIAWRIDECLSELQIPQHRHRKIQELSKGNQQKVQLIAAILHQPKLLILDEPFTGLDVENVGLFLNVIQKQKQAGVVILLSSHQLSYCEEVCDQLVFLNQGKVKLQGRISELKEQYPGMYLSYCNKERKALLSDKRIVLKKQIDDYYQYFISDKSIIPALAKALLSIPSTYELKMEQAHISDLISL